MGCVYCFRVGSENCFKVGRTKNPPDKRMKKVSVGSSRKLTLHREIKTNDPPFSRNTSIGSWTPTGRRTVSFSMSLWKSWIAQYRKLNPS